MDHDIEALYCEEEYASREIKPYKSYLHALEQVFDLGAVDSLCDAGCSAGGLLASIKYRYPKMHIVGIEYFEWAKKYADAEIKDKIVIADLSQHFNCNQKFDIVNCTVVGEHIPAECESVFINNLVNMANDILVLGWSEDKDAEAHQHLNPRKKNYIRSQIISKGFDIWSEATLILCKALKNEVPHGAYEWWHKPITVYRRRRYQEIHPDRFVQGTATDCASAGMRRGFEGSSLQSQVLSLRDKILLSSAKKKPLSILRFGDGDFFFVNALPNGSAKPGVRALRIGYQEKTNLQACRLGIFRADIITTEIDSMLEGALILMLLLEGIYRVLPNLHNKEIWQKTAVVRINSTILTCAALAYRSILLRLISLPLFAYLRLRLRIQPSQFPVLRTFPYRFETVYSLVASRIIFRYFPNDILLVGQNEKMEAIKILMQYKRYREYLGIESFCGYVGVEKIGAADNEESIVSAVRDECKKTCPKLILLGIGSAKLYVLPRIRFFSDAIVIDVGAGIDALAGVISQDRPYFADWINFKSKKINYNSMNMMDEGNPLKDSDKYQQILLD